MRVAGPLLRNEFGDIDHPTANKLLILERAGLQDGDFEYVEDDDVRGYEVVARGEAEGSFIRPYQKTKAAALGLSVLDLPPLMMVNSITLTTTWPKVEGRGDAIASLVRALAGAIRFMRDYPEQAKRLLHEHVAPRLNLQTAEEIELLYDKEMARLDERLFAHPEAVTNAFALALKYGDPELLSRINPMQLWDMRFVHDLHMSGFYDTELELPPQLSA